MSNSSKEFAAAEYTAGQLNAMVKKIIQQVGEEGPTLLLQGKIKIEIIKEMILKMIGTITTSPTTEKFVSKDKFVKNSKEVKFYDFFGSFQEDFLSGNGKTEEPLGEQELRYGDLIKNSGDSPIIEELGGEAKAETTLSEMYDLLKKQANGTPGVLLTNGRANIFYIRDKGGVLRTVRVNWRGDGWFVDACSVGYPFDWFAGRRVFSAILES